MARNIVRRLFSYLQGPFAASTPPKPWDTSETTTRASLGTQGARVPPDPPPREQTAAEYQLALEELEKENLDAAREKLEALLARDTVGDNTFRAECMNVLGHVLHWQNRWQEADLRFAAALALKPDYVAAHYNRGLNWLSSGHLQQALECFQLALQRAPTDADSHLAMGIALERNSEFARAQASFEMAARLNPKYNFAGMMRIDREYLNNLEKIAATNAACEHPPIVWRSSSYEEGHSSDLYVVVVCDQTYFERYGQAFVRSFAANAGDRCALHLHIMDPHPNFISTHVPLLEGATGRPISLSFETTAPAVNERAADPSWRRVWYTCARFVHLASWRRTFARPLIVLDIDAVIEHPVAKLVDALGDQSIGLQLREPRGAPWLDIVANVVVVRPTPEAAAFVNLVRAFLLHHRQAGLVMWHLDQVALYCVWRMCEQFRTSPPIAWIQSATEQVRWHLGAAYADKLASPRYRRYG